MLCFQSSLVPRLSRNVVLPELKLAEHVGIPSLVIPSGTASDGTLGGWEPCYSQWYKYWKAGWPGALSFPVVQVLESWVAGSLVIPRSTASDGTLGGWVFIVLFCRQMVWFLKKCHHYSQKK